VDLACEEKAAFIVIAGDLYDGDLRDYNTALFLQSRLDRLKQKGIFVYLALGNHDAQTRITKKLKLPENTFVFAGKKPETFTHPKLPVALHGQSYRHSVEEKNLSIAYPSALSGLINIGVLHTALSGRQGHEPYAPCTAEDLLQKGYDYWALGHVHTKEVVHEEPWIIFPGCTQGRNIRETGVKGCFVVKVQGKSLTPKFVALDSVRWQICQIDAAGLKSPEQVLEKAAQEAEKLIQENQGDVLGLRMVIKGQTRAHGELNRNPERWHNELRSLVADVTMEQAWVEKILFKTTTPLSLEKLLQEHPLAANLFEFTDRLIRGQEPDALAEVTKQIEPRAAKLPGELKKSPYELNLEDPDLMGERLCLARDLILERLNQKAKGEE
jgi:DNA repair exonuclease SbcCD nuclease subunit